MVLQFRKDINGLRAIAVIAVVLFHFNSSWLSGGFAGVDVFFVISGFLMTGIIIRGIEQGDFSILKFYVARANRIIPALAILCIVLAVFGWFYLTPLEYKALGKHITSSVGFISNIIYWRESGYFDTASHEKWLLHTWSLSVEWQFYIIYPLLLVVMRKFMSLKIMKFSIFIGTILSFIFCVIATYKWPNSSYYLLPTRTWEMMIGGVAFLYPITFKGRRKQQATEYLGIVLVILSYFFISQDNLWPGYLALFPVFGAFLIIQAQQTDSIFTNNSIFQKLGTWSYSIYLWHWPIVVAIYYYSLSELFVYGGIALSILLGFLSNKYIEKYKFRNDFRKVLEYLKCKPLYFSIIVSGIGSIIFISAGFIKLAPESYQSLIYNAKPSPYRNECHISKYYPPSDSCEYFEGDISWAIFGDSHTVEIAYALANKLKHDGVGLKHLSFSGCHPSYKKNESFNKCSKWYNESINYLTAKKEIKNIVFNHRFTFDIVGDVRDYSSPFISNITPDIIQKMKLLDELIYLFAKNKENVYIFYPIPELPKNIGNLISNAFKNKSDIDNIPGTSLAWYQERNNFIIEHFNNSDYPVNVHLIDVKDVFCDLKDCYAVRGGIPLYFDDDHPSLLGAERLVELIK
jgi:peptidoglycan/LPS O-acetylase OafA/YrhL